MRQKRVSQTDPKNPIQDKHIRLSYFFGSILKQNQDVNVHFPIFRRRFVIVPSRRYVRNMFLWCILRIVDYLPLRWRSGQITAASKPPIAKQDKYVLKWGGHSITISMWWIAMISQTVEYALRAVVTIAQKRGQSCTARQISAVTKVPAAYLSKILQSLVRGGIVKSQRGLNGGFVLTMPSERLTIFHVIEVVEPFKRIRQCPLGIPSHGPSLCPLHRQLDEAMAATETILRQKTIAQVLAEPGSVTPLCEEQHLVALHPVGAREMTENSRAGGAAPQSSTGDVT